MSESVIYLMGGSALDREALRLLLRQHLELEVAVDSDFAPVSVWGAMRSNPDIVLVDADAATAEVRDAVQMIPRLRKQARIVVLSAVIDRGVLATWGPCEIHGFVVKQGGVSELKAALSAVLAGEPYFSHGVREALLNGRAKEAGKPKLSRREIELLPLLARGMTLREAASKMTVSYKTADTYRTSLLRKLGIRHRVELARYAIRERIVDP